jgi:hypothetical protein
MYGATAWVGRDVEVLREYTKEESRQITARVDKVEQHAAEMGHPVLQSSEIRSLKDRMDKIDEWQVWWYQTVQPIDQRQDASIRMLENRVQVKE